MEVTARCSDLAGRRALVTGASSGIGLGGEDLCVSGGALLVVPRGQIFART